MMYPIMPPLGNRNLADIEQETPYTTYAWEPPLCPWCAQWLRPVDMRPVGMPFQAIAACPAYHGLYAFGQTRWVDFRPPKVARGSDGAWWTSLTIEQLQGMAATFGAGS